jgi:hypothetical protein
VRSRKGSIEVLLDDEESIGGNIEESDGNKSEDTVDANNEPGPEHADGQLSSSVCLEGFETGDCLSWSTELRCQHVFHGDCLMPWLMTKDDCPMCRTTLIEDSDYDTKDSDFKEKSVNSIEMVNGMVAAVKERGHLLFNRSADRGELIDTQAKDIEMISIERGNTGNPKKKRSLKKRKKKGYIAIAKDDIEDDSSDSESSVNDAVTNDVETGCSRTIDGAADDPGVQDSTQNVS